MKNQRIKLTEKVTILQLILTICSVIALVTSNLISSQLIVTGFKNEAFSAMTAAIIIFPVTCILSDVFSEIYGYRWSRWTCYAGFAFNLFVNLMLTLVASLNITGTTAEAYKNVFGITTGMGWCVLAASFIAYMIGDFINDNVFAKIKGKYHANDHKKFGFRAVLSTLCGQIFDSFIYLPLALNIFPKLFLGITFASMKTVIGMCVMQIAIKVLYEAITLPITAFATKKLGAKEKELNNITE